MLWTIMKNNFKLMLRNKMLIVMMILGPVLVIAAFSNAFNGLLTNAYESKTFTVGVIFEEDSVMEPYKEVVEDVIKEQDLTCVEYPDGDADALIKEEKADVVIKLNDKECTIYKNSNKDIEAMTCQYIMYAINEQFAAMQGNAPQVAIEGEANYSDYENMESMSAVNPEVDIEKDSLPYTKTASASDYYGIIEIIYFLWCGLFFMSSVIQSERKNKIQKRYVMSPASKLTLYLGKFLPGYLANIIGLSISALIATVLFDIHWGNMLGTIGLMLLGGLASTAFGIVCFYIVNNLAVSVVIEMMMIWGCGFIGGSFETYMYSRTPEWIKGISPIYYMNRCIVEYSTMGHSDFTVRCILVLVGITVVCGVIGMFIMNRRMEEK